MNACLYVCTAGRSPGWVGRNGLCSNRVTRGPLWPMLSSFEIERRSCEDWKAAILVAADRGRDASGLIDQRIRVA